MNVMQPELHNNAPSEPRSSEVRTSDINYVWGEFRTGSELAFTAIYKKYMKDLYHYGERFTDNKELIEDSIHDFFVELWKQRGSYGDVSNLKFYLLKGFKYRLLKNIKNSRRLPLQFNIDDDYDFKMVFSNEAEMILKQAAESQKTNLLKSINSLSKREKQAITLRFYDGLSYEEIANIMALSVKSAYKLMYRALDSLKDHLPRLY